MKLAKVFSAIPITLILISTSCSGLKSRTDIGLSPETHQISTVNVRDYTKAPLKAEVKVYLPISKQKAMKIVSDFEDYPQWVSPAPEKVEVDNSQANGGRFGVGSLVSYKKGETDEIVFYDPYSALIAKPKWGLENFDDHRGVVFITEYKDGIIMHMRRYFETKGMKGWFMSKMMPMFMKSSAENLAELYGGEVL